MTANYSLIIIHFIMNWGDVVYERQLADKRERQLVEERERRKRVVLNRIAVALERIAVALEMHPEAIKNTRKNKISK